MSIDHSSYAILSRWYRIQSPFPMVKEQSRCGNRCSATVAPCAGWLNRREDATLGRRDDLGRRRDPDRSYPQMGYICVCIYVYTYIYIYYIHTHGTHIMEYWWDMNGIWTDLLFGNQTWELPTVIGGFHGRIIERNLPAFPLPPLMGTSPRVWIDGLE